jgi:hypothetical protein
MEEHELVTVEVVVNCAQCEVSVSCGARIVHNVPTDALELQSEPQRLAALIFAYYGSHLFEEVHPVQDGLIRW